MLKNKLVDLILYRADLGSGDQVLEVTKAVGLVR